ncbi:hypothetical protein L21SP3_01635 [Sedimentisphaera cyanobacteriorum]|uniref:DUF2961 domain-containing protein n=1 Tax=Sedimentisphaera cyanobacteriorum TaxID=1940790 RepID=A0A1Q2HRE2_9BACT|nr:glycoside hydrolase family 172 protein [Sedimentisphaera cyanobacteriorum]AQQ09816.1 hypothetical protein L21SP3_01635 [Sedimentisphaera cyanobacteriorum]
MSKRFFTAIAIFSILIVADKGLSETVTFPSLLEEMVNPRITAQWPEPEYECLQFSSFDRDSRDKGVPSWWDNKDRSHFIRTEQNEGRKEFVLMDAEGPGAVVRFWSTWHGPGGGEFSNGTLRFYFNGSSEPEIEAPIADVLDKGYLAEAPLGNSVAKTTEYAKRGHNLYLPIPYSNGCKITYQTGAFIDRGAVEGEALYYIINCRKYTKGTDVKTFSLAQLEKNKALISEVQKTLEKGLKFSSKPAASFSAMLKKGDKSRITLAGSRCISGIKVKLGGGDVSEALRRAVIKIRFDGKPAVWAPLGDFFATGYQLHPYKTFYAGVKEDGTMYCRWIMPFRSDAQLAIENIGSGTVHIEKAEVYTEPWQWDENSLYFHSRWKQWKDIKTRSNKDNPANGAFDLNWITINGRGKYVGDALTIFNNAPRWWGEGDEKIYIDGEDFPSHFGTGTEDYYGYAWCRPAKFSAAFHAQPCGAGNFQRGFTVNSRFRSLDAIPFSKSLKFDMELWHWAETTVDYAPVMFWYAKKDSSSNLDPQPEEAIKPLPDISEEGRVQIDIEGAIEGERMQIVRCEGGRAFVQKNTRFGWSEDEQVWWQNGKPNQKLVLSFESEKSGKFKIYANLTKARDYAVVDIRVNGRLMKEGLDLFNPAVKARETLLGKAEIREGENSIEVQIKGANPKAVKRYMFGLDYIKLIEAE